MRCSKCGAENPEGLKFCNECATPFRRRCAKCGFENAPTAKFCGECAAHLSSDGRADKSEGSAQAVRIAPEADSQTISDGERKMVTALFADIKGSMDLMEDLDPEEARAIVDPALKLMMDAVHRYGGYVAQSTGDGIFALSNAALGASEETVSAVSHTEPWVCACLVERNEFEPTVPILEQLDDS
jgi:class 3 adenylate cyclase